MAVKLFIDHKPTNYISIKEALNQNLMRLESLGHFHQYQIRKQVDDYFDPKSESKFWLFSENLMEEDPQRSKVVEILHRLHKDKQSPLHKGKILVASIFRSVHDISLELLSEVSEVPMALLKNGLSEGGGRELWDKIAKGIAKISELPLFFFEWSSELPSLEKVLEQLYLSRVDDGFRIMILTEISNLQEFNESADRKFEGNIQHLKRFADKYGVTILTIP